MKKIYINCFLYTYILIFCSVSYCQISTNLVSITKPEPSVANLMNFVDIPVNFHTGIPSIDLPLFSMNTFDDNTNVSVALSYHPAGIAFTNAASDVGVGWSLIGGGVISRTLTYEPDEFLRDKYINRGWDVNNIVFDDVYSYNFMGYSGKFKIVYNQVSNTFVIEKLDINNIKITCEMTPGTQKVESFILYDDVGVKYVFDIKDRNNVTFSNRNWETLQPFNHYTQEPPPTDMVTVSYISAFHLKEVYDGNNVKIIDCQYSQHIKPGNVGMGLQDKVSNRMNIIESINFGKILLEYQYNSNLENTLNDPYHLNEIELRNFKNEFISKYRFNYEMFTIKEDRRHLSKIEKLNQNGQIGEKYEFEYQDYINNTNPYYCNDELYYGIDQFGYLNLTNPNFESGYEEYVTDGLFYETFLERTSKEACLYGVLKRIKYPTGGIREFEFESNTFQCSSSPSGVVNINSACDYELVNTDNHVYTSILNTTYTTVNSTFEIPLSVSGNTSQKLFIKLYPYPYYSQANNPPSEPLYASFRLVGNGIDKPLQITTATCLGDFEELIPGNYTIIVNSIENSSGQVIITKKDLTTQPLKEFVYGGGVRIKRISSYNSILSTTPEREINYEYNLFDNPNASSGELYDGYYRSFATGKATASQIAYKNVKVFDTQNNGFTRYTYESYTDSPFYFNSDSLGYFQNYFGYKNGILLKTEVFNNNNDLLNEEVNQYEFTETGNSMYINSMLDYNFGWFYAKPCWTKLISKTKKEFFYTGSNLPNIVTTTTNLTYNNYNKKIDEESVYTNTNSFLKTKYYYANNLNIQIMRDKWMIGIPLKTEKYRDYSIINSQEMTYKDWDVNDDNNQNTLNDIFFAPEFIKSSIGTNPLETKVAFKKVDITNGNPLEVQQESGISTSYIWGYNNTLPVAKLENIAYANIPTNLITDIQTLTSSPTATESQILAALNALRTSTDVNMQKAMITTYTFKPLIGVTSVTDPKGDRITYIYDDFNRLKEVRDKNDNLLSENEYRYKTQN